MRPPHPGDGGAPRTGSGLAGRRARAATRAVLGPVELFPVPGVQAPPPPCRPARGGAGRHGVRKHPSQHPWRFSHCGSLQVRAFKLRDVTIRRVLGDDGRNVAAKVLPIDSNHFRPSQHQVLALIGPESQARRVSSRWYRYHSKKPQPFAATSHRPPQPRERLPDQKSGTKTG